MIIIIIILFRIKLFSGIKYFDFKHIGNIVLSAVVSGLF